MELHCIDCLSDKLVNVEIENQQIQSINEVDYAPKGNLYIGPGLIDLQVNGYKSIDFNTNPISESDIEQVAKELVKLGVTSFFPTIITNSKESIIESLQSIYKACKNNSFLQKMIGGIHLEGPFLSKVEGARGAHPLKHIIEPNWEIFQQFQAAAGGMIKIITLAPEWENAIPFIKKCTENNVIVSIGHTNASPAQIQEAVKAGASMSTHLGNAAPLMLHRNNNLVWEQLAHDDLTTCLIADGFHLPESFLKTVIRTKKDNTILVSDSTNFAGMPPGVYDTHIGDQVVLENSGRLYIKQQPQFLAGAAFPISHCINFLIKKKLATLSEAWSMASSNVIKLLSQKNKNIEAATKSDLIIFELTDSTFEVKKVFKSGIEVEV